MKKQIKIEGMSCEHCVNRIDKALRKIDGVKDVSIDLNKKMALIEIDNNVKEEKIKETIDDLGYEVKEIKET